MRLPARPCQGETKLADGLLPFAAPLRKAVLLRRAGRLETVLAPRSTVWYLPPVVAGPPPPAARSRVTAGKAVLVDVHGIGMVTVDANLLAACVAHGLEAGAGGHPFGCRFGRYQRVRREVATGGRRIDIALLGAAGEPQAYLEVKSVTLAHGNTGLFPDAPTVRGAGQVQLLGAMAAAGVQTGVIFAAGRPDIQRIRPHREVDPKFAAALALAVAQGLMVVGCQVSASPAGLRLTRELPVDLN